MIDWQTANNRLRADRDAMNEAKLRESDARKRQQAADTRRQALAALARDGRVPEVWTVTRTIYGAPWFVAALIEGEPVRPTWSQHEADALLFDGCSAVDLQQIISRDGGSSCYVARHRFALVAGVHPEARA